MKKQLAFFAALAALSTCIQAQDVYGGVGLPGLVSIGYALPVATNWGLRGEYASGLSVNKDGVQEGVNVTGKLKASRVGAFADWYPFNTGFRVVGGLTINDIKADMNGVGSGTSTINNIPVDMTGETFNVAVNFPKTTPYLGIGYGHQSRTAKGLGFYADLGMMFGSFTADVNTSLVTSGKVTQADVDAQVQKLRDSVGNLSVLPSVSIGALYRF